MAEVEGWLRAASEACEAAKRSVAAFQAGGLAAVHGPAGARALFESVALAVDDPNLAGLIRASPPFGFNDAQELFSQQCTRLIGDLEGALRTLHGAYFDGQTMPSHCNLITTCDLHVLAARLQSDG